MSGSENKFIMEYGDLGDYDSDYRLLLETDQGMQKVYIENEKGDLLTVDESFRSKQLQVDTCLRLTQSNQVQLSTKGNYYKLSADSGFLRVELVLVDHITDTLTAKLYARKYFK